MKNNPLIHIAFTLLCLMFMTACSSNVKEEIKRAEDLATIAPDSAFAILEGIRTDALEDAKIKPEYDLVWAETYYMKHRTLTDSIDATLSTIQFASDSKQDIMKNVLHAIYLFRKDKTEESFSLFESCSREMPNEIGLYWKCVVYDHLGIICLDAGLQYWLIGLIAIIIFFICAILFESLYQSLVIILLIPTSMIGLFLTYYVTGVPFGTGGFAAMVMLSGLTVNAGIYIICEYRNCGNYLRAFNHKVIPIFLTIFSTVLGMIPFLIDGADEQPFWYSLAVGTIGGLSFSIIPLVVFLPLVMKVKRIKISQNDRITMV